MHTLSIESLYFVSLPSLSSFPRGCPHYLVQDNCGLSHHGEKLVVIEIFPSSIGIILENIQV